MPIFKSSVSIEATPEATFAYVRDIRNLPSFFDRVTSAEPAGEDLVRITAMKAGELRTIDAELRVKEGHRPRIEWSTEGPNDYHGWLEVDREGEVCSVTVEIHTAVEHEGVDQALDRSLFGLKAAVEAG